jgi:hypothetical protein
MSSSGRVSSKQNTQHAPTSAILPDSEYIPLYPSATIIETSDKWPESLRIRRLRLEAPDTRDKVEMFYKQELPRIGWLLDYDSSEHGAPYLSLYYTWIDPEGSLPWDMELDMGVESKPDSKAEVRIDYNRIPNVENMPLYADAQEVKVYHEEIPGDLELGGYPVRITTKTFVTRASQQEITDYYNATLPECGWFFSGMFSGFANSQTGNLQEGLLFRGTRRGRMATETSPGTTIEIKLSITAKPEADGQLRVQLRATQTAVAGFQ